MVSKIFEFTSANFSKLLNYGFKLENNVYRFSTPILDGQFDIIVFVSEAGEVSVKVIDNEFQEEYVLHLTEESSGEFVGKIRAEFERVLTDIRDKCFEKDIFKCEQSKLIIEYIANKYGDELEHLWEKTPTSAIWRRKDNRKWYGVMLVLSKRKLGIDSDGIVDIIDLRIDPEGSERIVDGKTYFAGYHMNKKHWFTICLDNSVPTERIFAFIDKSYILAKK